MCLAVYIFVVAVVCQHTFGFIDRNCDLNCSGHGSCHYGIGKQYCRCNSGYTGDHCQTRIACTYKTCQHYGRCESTSSSPYYKCTCNYGYIGNNCEHTHCVSSPCKNGGTCHRTHSGPYYYCSCPNHFKGHNCEIPPPTASTMQPLDLKTTTTSAVATTSPKIEQTCSKLSSVFDIAENVTETNQAAAMCKSGSHASPEAFVLNNCGLTAASTWKQGYNVMTWCTDIPPYTPIASFYLGQYDSFNSITGIFVGCLKDSKGFTLAVQLCDQAANIVHIVAGNETSNMNPKNYFTIEL